MNILRVTSLFVSLTKRLLLVIFLVTWPSLEAADWYVKAGAASNGNGSRNRPFNSLQQVETASRTGDTIYVLPARPALVLDGGIQLKSRQRLTGLGSSVLIAGPNSERAKLTNTQRIRYDGDIVRLSNDNIIENIQFDNAYRSSVFGINADGAKIRGNLMTNDMAVHNLDAIEGRGLSTCGVVNGQPICDGEWPNGFIIFAPQTNHFGAITLLACGPQPRAEPKDPLVKLDNYCSSLVPGSGTIASPVEYDITGNIVRDGNSDGIMIINDTGVKVAMDIDANLVKDLSQRLPDPLATGNSHHVVRSRGITVITIDTTTSTLDLDNFVASNLSPAGYFASDGLVLLAVGLNPVVNADIDGIVIDNPRLTGEHINGDSIELQHRSSRDGLLNVSIRNAILKDPANSNIKLIDSNNPTRGIYRVSVRDSFLYNRNLIGFEDNQIRYFATVAGTQVAEISLDLKNVFVSGLGRGLGSAITGNVSDIGTLKIKVESCSFSGLTDEAIQWINPATRTIGAVGGAIVDLGGGPLGSLGRNRFVRNGVPGYVPPGSDGDGIIETTESGLPVELDGDISLINAAAGSLIQLWANNNYWGGGAPVISAAKRQDIYSPTPNYVVIHPITSYLTQDPF